MTRLFHHLSLMLLIVTACANSSGDSVAAEAGGRTAASYQSPVKSAAISTEARQWADSVCSTMSLRQQVGQLFVPVVDPQNVSAAKTTLRRYVETDGVGGILFSKGSLKDYVTLINYAQSMARVPLLVTLDGEWGLAMRVPDAPRFPYNMSLGAIGDDRLLYEYGREVARECRRAGIHVNFAPVLDVNSNPANPVIGYRSFGENPDRVSALALAYSRGLEDGGVMSVGKHFPGHGDTSKDSHHALPEVTHDMATLDSVDLVPFRRYIDEGLSGIMVGHLNVPALDASGRPASLSAKVTTGLLRDRMGFDGLVFTDALVMKGAKTGGNVSVAAFKAGADVLLSPASLSADINAMLAAVKSGEISEDAVRERCRKILAYKYALGLNRYNAAPRDGLTADISSPEADAVNRRLHRAMITCLANRDSLLPLRGAAISSVAVVSSGDDGHTFTDYCSRYTDIATYTASQALASPSAVRKHDTVILALYDDKETSRRLLDRFAGEGTVAVFFVNPYKMAKFGAAVTRTQSVVLVGEKGTLAEEYAAQALFGGIEVSGRLPVNLKGLYPLGTGITLPKTRLGYTSPADVGFASSMTARLDSLVNVGLSTGAFPGCQLLVAKDGEIVVDKAYGRTTRAVGGAPVTRTTIYDLASVSKALGMLPGIMKAYDDGLISLDAPASDYVAPLRDTDKASITLRQLLYHESGLPAALDIYGLMVDTASYTGRLLRARPNAQYPIKIGRDTYINKDARLRRDITSPTRSEQFPIEAARGLFVSPAALDTVREAVYRAKLRTPSYRYSDLNFCLLMDVEENVTGQPHEQWVEEEIFAPLGVTRTLYRPLTRYKVEEIAPTEKDMFLRRQTLQGYVHDETAAMSGGVQGNAGLFSTAGDLAKICQMWLNGGSYGGERILSEATTRTFLGDKSPLSRRGLGFDKPDMTNPSKSPTAPEASPSTVGHVGFTGTCFWIDPESDLIYIFLCNRVNPTRDNAAFSRLDIRPKLLSLIYQSMER
ncbi:MAG: serine hydrolase [Pseudoflavonifractor sp.]|nr:serine hydrolase [Pseudoflavonifractor sp.]